MVVGSTQYFLGDAPEQPSTDSRAAMRSHSDERPLIGGLRDNDLLRHASLDRIFYAGTGECLCDSLEVFLVATYGRVYNRVEITGFLGRDGTAHFDHRQKLDWNFEVSCQSSGIGQNFLSGLRSV